MNKTDNSNNSSQVYIFFILASVIVIVIYMWFILPSFSKPGTNFYSQLAIGFKKGQLYLPEQPSAALLALNDPYDYTLRKDSNVEDFPWDVSLYDGKFYIYWGPSPAVLLTGLSINTLAHLGDEHLVFVFLCGLFIYSALFAKILWFKFNYNLPGWAIGPVILAIGLYVPVTLMLSNAKIYEAAIAGCQFFFIGGCYWAYEAIDKEGTPASWRLVLAGAHWALAIGTRITILPVIGFTALATLTYILREDKLSNRKKLLQTLFAIGTPLLISAAGLGWYNWARFGSALEFGMRFQLASVNYSQFSKLFSARYIFGNFLTYFTQPYQIQAEFPFIRTVENLVTNDRFAGLLYTSPYILITLIYLAGFTYFRFKPTKAQDEGKGKNPQEKWLVVVFAGSFILSLVIILSYYFTAIRFTEDFMPALVLLTTICLGKGYESFGDRKWNTAYLILVVFLISISVTTSTLIAIPTGGTKLLLKYAEKILELFYR
jgi:hypothetical protein